MWEISSLFENLGTVQDGINTLSVPNAITDYQHAVDLEVSEGAISFNNVSFAYNDDDQVFSRLDLDIKGAEKSRHCRAQRGWKI